MLSAVVAAAVTFFADGRMPFLDGWLLDRSTSVRARVFGVESSVADADVAVVVLDERSLDSEVLLAHCLHKERSYLFTWPDEILTRQQQDCFRELVLRRLKPEPVAYLVGRREFYSMSLITTPATLVPRAETEMLVDCVLSEIQVRMNACILELGTGTGAIALAIKRHHPSCEVTATDVSEKALEVARSNAEKFSLNVKFLASDWYQAISCGALFDVIVSNPPYIAEHDPYLAQGDLPAEPRHALCAGVTGLEALRIIIEGADRFLRPGGLIVLEHGYDQAEAVQALFAERCYHGVETHKDFNNLPRVTLARIGAE